MPKTPPSDVVVPNRPVQATEHSPAGIEIHFRIGNQMYRVDGAKLWLYDRPASFRDIRVQDGQLRLNFVTDDVLDVEGAHGWEIRFDITP